MKYTILTIAVVLLSLTTYSQDVSKLDLKEIANALAEGETCCSKIHDYKTIIERRDGEIQKILRANELTLHKLEKEAAARKEFEGLYRASNEESGLLMLDVARLKKGKRVWIVTTVGVVLLGVLSVVVN